MVDDRRDRIDQLLARAQEEHDSFDEPADPDERALSYLREGLWPVLSIYIDARGRDEPFSAEDHARLESALNAWLELYALCYGVEITAEFSVRETAELFVDTHNIRDTAQLLTGVPEHR